ncbi:MAG: 16S rRNA (guanine(966)-N(2))-methyltransferase RsmD [Deltaproteobacteria bacterium]|nr:MAG: 16S rRNA (guanine(966)-N(2))-methyltransferase RsmD [Deltaproteobacteria bacterium]
MRIIAGKYKGLRLATPKGKRLRPTAERVREAIFNILGYDLSELSVLDLFAGTGAMGLEALSRGAISVVIVDQHPAAIRLIGRNLAACGNPENARVYKLDLRRGLKSLINKNYSFDLVFLDPPYGRGLTQRCLEQLGTGKLLNPAATVVSEHAIDENLTSTYGCLHRETMRVYGTTGVSFYSRGE